MRFLSKMRKAIWQRVMAAGFLDKVNPVPLICLKGLDRVYMILRIGPNFWLSKRFWQIAEIWSISTDNWEIEDDSTDN